MMTKWQGFLTESKSFMNYPQNKWKFWINYPISWLRFRWCWIRDWWLINKPKIPVFVVFCDRNEFIDLMAKLARTSQAYGKNKALVNYVVGREEMRNAFKHDKEECLLELYELLGHRNAKGDE